MMEAGGVEGCCWKDVSYRFRIVLELPKFTQSKIAQFGHSEFDELTLLLRFRLKCSNSFF
jgi:hypothetical protein